MRSFGIARYVVPVSSAFYLPTIMYRIRSLMRRGIFIVLKLFSNVSFVGLSPVFLLL